jgi:hypothetical protein
MLSGVALMSSRTSRAGQPPQDQRGDEGESEGRALV